MLTPSDRKILVLPSSEIERGTLNRDPGGDEVVDVEPSVGVLLVL
jgi:hypothetical protein